MSPRRAYSGRRYRRRRSPLPALLLVIVLAAVFCLAMAYSARIEAALLRLVTRLTGGRKEKRP